MLDRWRHRLQLAPADDTVPEPPDEDECWEFVSGRTSTWGGKWKTLRSKYAAGQFNEVLYKVIAHNLVCVIHAMRELRLEMPTFARA